MDMEQVTGRITAPVTVNHRILTGRYEILEAVYDLGFMHRLDGDENSRYTKTEHMKKAEAICESQPDRRFQVLISDVFWRGWEAITRGNPL